MKVDIMSDFDSKKLSRRDFLIVLGGVVGASVVGWIAAPKVSSLFSPGSKETSSSPELLDCLRIKDIAGGTEVYDVSDPSKPTLVCKVNQIGGVILHQLNGRNTLEDIVRATGANLNEKPTNVDLFTSRVALFITKLAGAGFMKKPFYVNLTVNEYAS
jgi:hypothetical protein